MRTRLPEFNGVPLNAPSESTKSEDGFAPSAFQPDQVKITSDDRDAILGSTLFQSDGGTENRGWSSRTWLSVTSISVLLVLFAGGTLYHRQSVRAQMASPAALSSLPLSRWTPPSNVFAESLLATNNEGSISTGDSAIRNVVGAGDGIAVEIGTEGNVVPQTSTEHGPERVILDFPRTGLATELRRIRVNTAGVKAVRMAMHTPSTARVVVDLVKPSEYTLAQSNNEFTLRLRPLAQ